MEPRFCQYCGGLLQDRCGCAADVARAREDFWEDYYTRPSTLAGWAFEDRLENFRNER